MPRYAQRMISSDLVSPEIQRRIKSFRPVRLFISKQKKKGATENPLNTRVRFNRLSSSKQAKFLQKSVDKYLQLLEEHDIDECVQRECKLFDYLLLKSEQRKYFDSIHAPAKPLKKASAYYSQDEKSETGADEETDTSWDDLTPSVQRLYQKKNREAKIDYIAQVKNFAADLPDRLKVDYLRYAEVLSDKNRKTTKSSANGHDDQPASGVVRQRRKSLTALPDSLQTEQPHRENESKLSRCHIRALHRYTPSTLYYEEEIPEKEKLTFFHASTKNAHVRSLFNQATEEKRLEYILKSVEKLEEYLQENPSIVERKIPTLHHLLGKTEDILLYFSSLGLPTRPPSNRLVLYNSEKEETASQLSWAKLPQSEKDRYGDRLSELKRNYYEKLIEFIDETLPNEYMQEEFYRNVKNAMKDYGLASKDSRVAKARQKKHMTNYLQQQMTMKNKMSQFHQIKEKLRSTPLTSEQEDLLTQLTDLVNSLIEDHSASHVYTEPVLLH